MTEHQSPPQGAGEDEEAQRIREAAEAAGSGESGAEGGEEGEREVDETSVVAEPASVFDELGEMQADARKDDTRVLDLIPGRFRGRLAVRVRRIDPKKRKKKVRKLAKRGVTDEAELQYAAEVIAEATDAILYRPKDGDKLVEAQTISAELGDAPVKWDQRLGKMLKMDDVLSGTESEAMMVRLVFKNQEALDAFYTELELWLREAAPVDEDDEEERGERGRPT